MISIKMIASSKVAASYFKEADYYAKNSESEPIPSEWHGKGAERLGLSGVVDGHAFSEALDGRLPNGEVLGRIGSDGVVEHKKGWDFTFSAPKSVSILALVGGDERLLKAHQEAVRSALDYIEKKDVVTRQSILGTTVPVQTGNLAAALFTHTTSRALDPQLHTHSIIMNATERQDGTWKSIESRKMYDSAMMAGMVYRSELAKLSRDLGYTVVPAEKGTFELAEVSAELRESMSTRRKEILKAKDELGLTTSKQMSKAAVMTREVKKHADANLLLAEWKKGLSEKGFDTQSVVHQAVQLSAAGNVQRASEGHSQHEHAQASVRSARKDLLFAYERLAEKEAVFSQDEIIKIALERGLGDYGIAGIEASLAQLKRDGVLLNAKTPDNAEGVFLTTERAITQEAYILSLVDRGRGEVKPIARPGMVKDIGTERGLTTEQFDAAKLLLTTKDRVVGIQGYAGTGKTYMLDTVREVAEQRGHEVTGMAMTGLAAERLQADSGIKSQTLASFLHQAERDSKDPEKRALWEKGGKEHVWVVDESSLISAGDMAELLTASRRQKARVVLVGDKAQIAAISWGKPFNQLLRAGMAHAVMKDIQRQKSNPALLSAVKDSLNGQVKKAMEKIGNQVIEVKDDDDRIDSISNHYLKMTPQGRSETLIVIPDNSSRTLVNASVRAGLQQEGAIGLDKLQVDILASKGFDKAQKQDAKSYQSGDWVQFGRDYRQLDVKANDLFRVSEVKGDRVILKDEQGKVLEWQPDRVAGKSNRGVEVYRRESRGLSERDKIVLKKTDKTLGIKNGNDGVVKSIDEKNVTLTMSDGTEKTIDLNKFKYWDHAYAITAFASQGQTYKNAIVLAESWRKNLVNQKFFYVGISRAKDNAYVYTDDKDKLIESLSVRTGEKTSGLEGRGLMVDNVISKSSGGDNKVNKFFDKIFKSPQKDFNMEV